jgi:hypothetical protein
LNGRRGDLAANLIHVPPAAVTLDNRDGCVWPAFSAATDGVCELGKLGSNGASANSR